MDAWLILLPASIMCLLMILTHTYLVPARKPVKQATISGEVNSPTNKMGTVACFKGYFSTT